MATVIDALLVTLGLDASGMKSGQKDTSESLKKIEDQATITGKEMELRGKQMAGAFGQIRNQVVGLFAAFTAGAGIKAFISDVTATDAATGRLAKNMGMSSETLTAWQGVADRAGGSASGIAGSMQGLTNQFQQLALTGQSSVVPYFRAVGVQIADASGRMRPMGDILLDLADKFSKMDPAKAQALGAGMGLDSGTINVLMQGRSAVTALLAEQEKLGHANKADTDSAASRQKAMNALTQASEDLGRKLLTAATPAILMVTDALTKFSTWAAQHRDLVQAVFIGLTVAVVAFAAVLAAPLAGVAALTVAIAAAVAAIAILYDDWTAWTSGGQSAFAGFWQYFADKWASVSGTVLPIFDAMKTYVMDLVRTFKDAFMLIYTLFFGTSSDIRAAWETLTGDLGNDVLAFVDLVKKLGPALLDAFKAAFNAAFDWVEGRAKAIWDAIGGKKIASAASEFKEGFVAPFKAVGGAIQSAKNSVVAGISAITGTGAEADVAKFMAMGWSKEQAAGLAANIQRESSGNEKAVGDNGQAYGLGQWHKDRQANFAKWAGKDIKDSTRDEQLAFMNYELREGTEKKAGEKLAQATDAAAAGAVVSQHYERPADKEGEADVRARMAVALASRPQPDPALAKVIAPGPQPDPALAMGASAAVASNTTNNNSSTASTSHSETSIGTINIQTAATDAQGIAKGIGPAVEKYGFATQANYGLS